MYEYEDTWAQDDVADTAYVARSQVPTAIYQTVTTKVPPLYDGRSSWFAFEEAIDDWCDITELEPEKRGPALRNRLEGEAAIYKSLLDRERLRNAEDGVNYFKRELRPHFVKGNQSVFLWRFFQLFRASRGQQEFLRWIGRYQVLIKRLMDAWMDLHEIQTDEAIAGNSRISARSVRSRATCRREIDAGTNSRLNQRLQSGNTTPPQKFISVDRQHGLIGYGRTSRPYRNAAREIRIINVPKRHECSTIHNNGSQRYVHRTLLCPKIILGESFIKDRHSSESEKFLYPRRRRNGRS